MTIKFSERIVYKDETYQIERSFPDKRKPHEYFPVSSWGLTKSTSSTAIVKRELENSEDLDNPSNIALYEIPITWTVLENNPLAKAIFLVHGDFKKVLDEGLRHYEFYDVVFVKYLGNGIETREAQLQNSGDFPFSMVTVTKGKPKRIPLDRAKLLIASKTCLGVYTSKDLTELIV